jgi:hypothetical protein
MIGAGHVWPIASGMHDVIDRRVRAFAQGLARDQTVCKAGG